MSDALNDAAAERELLGMAMFSRFAAEALTSKVAPEDFSVIQHQQIAHAIADLHGAGVDPSPHKVAAQVDGVAPATLVEWASTTTHEDSGDVMVYVNRVVELAGCRRLRTLGSDLVNRAAQPGVSAAGVAEWTRERLDQVDLPDPNEEPATLDEFLEVAPEPEWIVEGVAARLDRLLIVAQEGGGKTTFLRQMAMMISQGIHPWHYRSIPPVNVLYIDLENPPMLARRQLAKLRDVAVEQIGPDAYDPRRLRVVMRPEGIDVANRSDAWWLMRQVATTQPDLVIVGPAYKLHEAEEEKSQDVRAVLKVLDRIRTRWNCALWMETHAPHDSFSRGGVIRPAGSRLWLRWPEFVLTLTQRRPNDPSEWAVGHARPPRDQRTWPTRLVRNANHAWPWEPVMF